MSHCLFSAWFETGNPGPADDRVLVHLDVRGHFTGMFKALKGQGQRVDFRATDSYQIDNGRIAANWYIEDNISLMAQLQAQPPAS